MNPWWRRPSAESSSSASEATPSRSASRRSDDDERSGSSRGRRGGRRRGRGRGRKNNASQKGSEQTQSQGPEKSRRSKPKRVAVLLDYPRTTAGYGSCDWQPENVNELIDRALRATLGAPDGYRLYLRAYAPWSELAEDCEAFDEAGFECIETGGSSGTVRMVVDAVERSYGRNPCETFVLISASDDLAPMVDRLRERRRTVLACSFKSQASPGLEEGCTSYRYLDDEPVIEETPAPAEEEETAPDQEPEAPAAAAETVADPFALLHAAAENVAAEGGAVWGTLVRQTMQSMHPGFTEIDHGFNDFGAMLEEAQRRGIVSLEKDTRSNTYYLSALATA